VEDALFCLINFVTASASRLLLNLAINTSLMACGSIYPHKDRKL
jgi:hypothetical protein